MDMMQSIEDNETLLRVGISFQSMEARHRVSEALERNYERCQRVASQFSKRTRAILAHFLFQCGSAD